MGDLGPAWCFFATLKLRNPVLVSGFPTMTTAKQVDVNVFFEIQVSLLRD